MHPKKKKNCCEKASPCLSLGCLKIDYKVKTIIDEGGQILKGLTDVTVTSTSTDDRIFSSGKDILINNIHYGIFQLLVYTLILMEYSCDNNEI